MDELASIVVLCSKAADNEHAAQLGLQDAMNKQPGVEGEMAAAAQMLHDTAKAIINNLKA